MWSSLIVLVGLCSASNLNPDCLSYSDTGDCLSCSSGLYPSGTGCVTCDSEPVICTQSDVDSWECVCPSTSSSTSLTSAPGPSSHCTPGFPCLVCTSGACLNSLGECVTCPTQSPGCLSIDSYGNCALCADGYYPNGNTCNLCNPKCDKCDWAEVCTHCVSPYELIDGYCCEPNCLSCNLNKCWQCNTGSLLSSGVCGTCPANCGGCPNGICDGSGATTVTCPSNCATCSSSSYCDTCVSGYYSKGGVCTQCNSRCSDCVWTESCTDCVAPYHLVDGYCCDAGCTSCNFEICWQCQTGYLFENNKCKSCPADCGGCPDGICNKVTCPTECTSCTTSTSCDECVDGKYWNGRECTACNPRCSTCDYAEVCTGCVSPYTLIEGYCCDAHCVSCKFEKCWQCATGYLLGADATCGTCPSNCGGCPDGLCVGGGGSTGGGSTVTCMNNCDSCLTADTCEQCAAGYYYKGGLCVKCNSRCTTCDWTESCTGCVSIYNLVEGYCCDAGCITCNFETCWQCQTGYLFENNKCLSCPADCGGCPDGICNKVTCPNNCVACTSSSSCDTCTDGLYWDGTSCTACNPRCSKCSYPEVCTGCVTPYTLIDGYCCDAHCVSCKFEKCWQCATGYLLGADSTCGTCPSNCGGCPDGLCVGGGGSTGGGSTVTCMNNCDSCLTADTCEQCAAGYYYKGGLCVKCNSRCTTCDWTESCTGCVSVYHLVEGYCCDAGCISCNFETCWQCQTGYLFENNKCLSCPADCGGCPDGICTRVTCPNNCVACTSSSSCDTCTDGLYWDGTSCTACNPRCSKCSYPEVCTGCVTPYTLIDGYCCDAHCVSCKFEKCWQCATGYLLGADATCGTCPSNCGGCPDGLCVGGGGSTGGGSTVTCMNNCDSCLTADTCEQCAAGYYYKGGLCVKCNSRCTTCDWTESCTGCVSVYHLVEGYCCDAGCISCNFETCWQCQTGYLFENNKCLSCPADCGGCPDGICTRVTCPNNCVACTTSSSCDTCTDGLYWDGTSCTTCNPRCSKCNYPEVCTGCVTPYILIDGYCCDANCVSCKFEKCWQCASGFVLNSDGTCSTCPSDCGGCPYGLCLGGSTGGGSTGGGSTVTCPNNCDSCTSTSNCDQCSSGYYPNAGLCAKCNDRCTTCDWAEVCTDCATNYHLVDGYCCDAGCTSCRFEVCWACGAGKILENNRCVDCPANCGGCPKGVCDAPPTCPTDCTSCTSSSSCDACRAGYYLNNGGCAQCNSRCSECTWSSNCDACNAPYVLKYGFCCPAACSSCNADICWGCEDGYLYENGQCGTCPDTCSSCTQGVCDGPKVCPEGCSTCISSTVCTGCLDGYYASGSLCTPCNPRCTTCESAELCGGCKPPFNLLYGYCCLPGCTSCNLNQCFGCGDGYLFQDSACITCPDTCRSCTAGQCDGPKTCIQGCDVCYTSTTCSVCKDGYYLGNYICNNCNPRCTKCTWSNACTECVAPYLPILGYCCPVGCSSCDWDKCTGCDQGLFNNGVSCVACPADCISCSNGQCIPRCPDSCETCTSSTVCTSCKSGYYFSNWACTACRPECLTCNSYDICTSCVSTLNYVSGFCCNKACTSCTWSKCNGCVNGYIYDGTTCKPCPNTCSSCTNGICNTAVCSANCVTCTSSTSCTKCKDGYYASYGGCYLCYTGCKTCTDYYKCSSCVTGQFVDTKTGACCNNKCSGCNFSGCTGCKSPYKFTGYSCI